MKELPLFTTHVPMIGRARIFERMSGDLTKATPQHLSVVGPRYSGKTVLLDAVAQSMTDSGKFECVLSWDLGHHTPQCDTEFLSALQTRVAEGLKEIRRDLFDYLTEDEAGYDELREVIDALGKKGKSILMIWDGFDRPLREGKLTRNLWDNLLELCRQDGLVLVTATRKKLQELVRDEKSVTSEFWQVFEVVPLGPLDMPDIEEFVAVSSEHQFQPGAVTELENWSGGIPPLVVALLNQVQHLVPQGYVSNEVVNKAAETLDEKAIAAIEAIWNDLPESTIDLFRLICEKGEFVSADAGRPDRSLLLSIGLARQAGNKLIPGCKLMARHSRQINNSTTALEHLFGTWNAYQGNIRGILERRISQIPRFDDRLFRMVERGLKDLPSYPEDCLNNLTHIEERALDLIWGHEADQDRCFPAKVISSWSEATLRIQKDRRVRIMGDMVQADETGDPKAWSVPSDRTAQLTLLQYLTGSHQVYCQSIAIGVSKDTYALLNAVHSFRNRSQHASGQAIHLGVAVSAVMLCVELLACLQRELQVGTSAPPITQP